MHVRRLVHEPSLNWPVASSRLLPLQGLFKLKQVVVHLTKIDKTQQSSYSVKDVFDMQWDGHLNALTGVFIVNQLFLYVHLV